VNPKSADWEQNGADHLLDIEPDTLSRDELIGLVRDLQAALVRLVQGRPTRAAARPRAAAESVPGADYTILFDGGALGNPGLGYGSYEIVSPEGGVAARTLEFGDGMTNNQAEFRALIAALEDLLERSGQDASSRTVAVRGDSQLVIRSLSGEWKVKHPGLQPLHRQASDLLRRFGSVDLAWHPRRESVRAFGH
jgi:ribonuclease HI